MGGKDGKPISTLSAACAPYFHIYYAGIGASFGLFGLVNPDLMASLGGLAKLPAEHHLWANMLGVTLLGVANVYTEAVLTSDKKLGKVLARGRIVIGFVTIGLVVAGKASREMLKWGIPDVLTGVLEFAF